jgi:predicted nucleic acid-binding protein
VVPLLWYAEVTNGILVAERRQICNREQSALFLTMLGELTIVDDEKRPAVTQLAMLDLARTYGLTGYDATYLELVLRTGCALVTFDRQLADATRKAGGRVFGDPE